MWTHEINQSFYVASDNLKKPPLGRVRFYSYATTGAVINSKQHEEIRSKLNSILMFFSRVKLFNSQMN